MNNREDNLKKLAKNNSARLNLLYAGQQEAAERKRVLSSAANTALPSSHSSKRNVIPRRTPVPQGKATANSSFNNTSGNDPSRTPAPLKQKDFVIKQKAKREYTNENIEYH